MNISPTQAAQMLKVSGRTVVNYCQRGILRGTKNEISGRWIVSLESVLRLKAEAKASDKQAGHNKNS